jgi:hypothetical protein
MSTSKNILTVAIVFFLLANTAIALSAEVIIDQQNLKFTPDRNDLTIKEVWFRVQCHKEMEGWPACDNFEVPGGWVSESFIGLLKEWWAAILSPKISRFLSKILIRPWQRPLV